VSTSFPALKCMFLNTLNAKKDSAAITAMYSALFLNIVPQMVYQEELLEGNFLTQWKSK
jgi:hypothetical protein